MKRDSELDNKSKKNKINITILNNKLKERLENWVEENDGVKDDLNQLFLKLGIQENDDIVLDDYNEKDFSFSIMSKYYFCKHKAKMTLIDNIEEDRKNIIVSLSDAVYNFQYSSNKEKGLRIAPTISTIYNPINENLYWRHFNQSCYTGMIKNEDNILQLDIYKPVETKNKHKKGINNAVKLNREYQLEYYLLGLVFPVSIDEVYKQILEIYPYDLKMASKVVLKIKKKEEITDLIYLNNNQLQDLIITKKGKKTTLNNIGEWSCSNVSVKDKVNNLSLIALSEDEVKNVVDEEEFNETKQEIEEFKQLFKTKF